MRLPMLLVALAVGPLASAQEGSFQAEKAAGPPEGIAAPILGVLEAEGTKVIGEDKAPVIEVWLRKSIPGKAKPAGPSGAILYPTLAEGELLGVARFPAEGSDFRENTIAAGVYTLRYGLLPENGAHLGVSEYRDYALLVPIADDPDLKPIALEPLQKKSAKATGSAHPGILMLAPPPDAPIAAGAVELFHDELKQTWALSRQVEINAEGAPTPMPMRLVVVGAAMD